MSEELSEAELAEKRRYVASRAARDHWSASELDHVDDMARWLATLDRDTAAKRIAVMPLSR